MVTVETPETLPLLCTGVQVERYCSTPGKTTTTTTVLKLRSTWYKISTRKKVLHEGIIEKIARKLHETAKKEPTKTEQTEKFGFLIFCAKVTKTVHRIHRMPWFMRASRRW